MSKPGRISPWAVLMILPLTILLLAGCEEEATTPPLVKKAAKSAPVESAKTGETSGETNVEYIRLEYPNGVRRNPFLPDAAIVLPQHNKSQGAVREREPLEGFGLGELSLVAIISETAIPKAMFIDPQRFGHVVKEGDRIGRNGGVVSDIRENEVEVLEASGDDDEGQTLQRVVKLRDVELTVSDSSDSSDLSEEEREALKRLLESEAGRKAIEDKYKERASGANASGAAPANNKVDPRFKGFAPPK